MKSLITSILLFVSLNTFSQNCPDKIHWKKLKTESEVQVILNNCLPLQSEKSVIFTFLSKHKAVYSEAQDGIIYASALTRSKSLWIEKQWLMEFVLDNNERLIEIRVKIGLTGP